MRNFIRIAACVINVGLSAISFAQTAPSIVISPVAPSSADTITMRIDRGRASPYFADSYRVSQQNNRLRVTLGSVALLPGVPPPSLPNAQFTFVELGRFPAGSYSVDVVAQDASNRGEVAIATGLSLLVSDARTSKSAPYVQLNYADHWWNPAESGWGLFIRHDNRDRVLAAWFTYGSDNKPE